MKQPETKLERRLSDPDAVATDWGETRRTLEKAKPIPGRRSGTDAGISRSATAPLNTKVVAWPWCSR
jgi:hypothetical protein